MWIFRMTIKRFLFNKHIRNYNTIANTSTTISPATTQRQRCVWQIFLLLVCVIRWLCVYGCALLDVVKRCKLQGLWTPWQNIIGDQNLYKHERRNHLIHPTINTHELRIWLIRFVVGYLRVVCAVNFQGNIFVCDLLLYVLNEISLFVFLKTIKFL